MNDEIVTRIQTVIAHYGLTVSTFADAIGVQRSSVSHLLSGRNKPSLDFVMKLVQTYPAIDFYWLLRGEGDFPTTEKHTTVPPPHVSYEKEEETFLLKRKQSTAQISKSDSKQPVRTLLFYADGTFESFAAKKE